MNSPKGIVSLGVVLILSLTLMACGGGSKPKPPAGPPTIETVILPQGAVNLPYGVNGFGAILSAIGGTGPYTWSITSGSLPPGLSLNAQQGLISGTPTTLGNYPFTVQVTDAANMTASTNLSIYIEGVVVISSTCGASQVPNFCPSGSPGVPYSVQLTASGGLAPYTWCVLSASSGSGSTCDPTQASLPPGLSLNTATGVISGTPTTAGTPATFTVQLMDSETSPGVPAVGSSSFTITIMSIVTTALPPGNINVAYSTTLTVAGGSPNYTWTATNLPPGLSLDPSTCISSKRSLCTLTGTPTTNGVYYPMFQVTDGEKGPAVATATLKVIIGPVVITTASLPAGTVGIQYSTTFAATGGIPPYTWCVVNTSGACDPSQASLPPGLTLSSAGVLSGTPTTNGTFGFTVQVADSGSGNQQQMVTGAFNVFINLPLTNANLSGNYAFNFNGFKNGNPVVMAGAFVADGNGGFTAGVLDYNDGTGEAGGNIPTPQHVMLAQSSYSIQPNGLGTMTLVTDAPQTFNFSIVIRSDGSGSLIEDNADPAERGSGAIKKQTPTDFLITSLNGTFAVGFLGTDPSIKRYAGAGVFRIINGQGDFDCSVYGPNGCPADINDNGAAAGATFLGTFSTTIDVATGRGLFVNFTFNQDHSHVYVYAYYIVNRNEYVLVSTNPIASGNPIPLTLWSVHRQLPAPPNGFDNTMLNSTSAAELSALDTNGAADVTAGLFVGKGVAGNNCQGGESDPATFNFDENQGGTASQQSSSGTYCVDKTTARVTLTNFTGSFGVLPPVFYMVAADQAFVVGTDAAVTSGVLEPQSGSPFTNASVSGPYAGGTVTPVVSQTTDTVTSLFADAVGNINGASNTSGPGGPGSQNFMYTYTVDSTGRAVVQQSGNTIGVLYVVSATKFVMLPATDPNPVLSVLGQ
jgi:hypothetical protein